jgi:hypothetical protein
MNLRGLTPSLIASVGFFFLTGFETNDGCQRAATRLTCDQIHVVVAPGACTELTNPCGDHRWVDPTVDGEDAVDTFTFVPHDQTELVLFRDLYIDTRPELPRRRFVCAERDTAPSLREPLEIVYTRRERGSRAIGQGTMLVTVTPRLVVEAQADPRFIQAGESSLLHVVISGGVEPYSIRWNPSPSLQGDLASPSLTASPTVTTLYTVTVTDSVDQLATGEVGLPVGATLAAEAQPPTVAPGEPSRLTVVLSVGGAPPYTYSWHPAETLSDPASESPIARPWVTTQYRVKRVDAIGDEAAVNVLVTVHLSVSATASPAMIQAGGSSSLLAQVRGGSPPYRYEWAPAAGLNAIDVADPIASPTAATPYTVTATDLVGTQASATVGVDVLPAATCTARIDESTTEYWTLWPRGARETRRSNTSGTSAGRPRSTYPSAGKRRSPWPWRAPWWARTPSR